MSYRQVNIGGLDYSLGGDWDPFVDSSKHVSISLSSNKSYVICFIGIN